MISFTIIIEKNLIYRARSAYQLWKLAIIMDEIGKIIPQAQKWQEEISLKR